MAFADNCFGVLRVFYQGVSDSMFSGLITCALYRVADYGGNMVLYDIPVVTHGEGQLCCVTWGILKKKTISLEGNTKKRILGLQLEKPGIEFCLSLLFGQANYFLYLYFPSLNGEIKTLFRLLGGFNKLYNWHNFWHMVSCNFLYLCPKVHPETYFLNNIRQVFTMEISLQPYWCLWRKNFPIGKSCQSGRAHIGTEIKTGDVLPEKWSPANAGKKPTLLYQTAVKSKTPASFSSHVLPSLHNRQGTFSWVQTSPHQSEGPEGLPLYPRTQLPAQPSSLFQEEAKLRDIDLIQGQWITADIGKAEVFLRTIMASPMES